MVSKGFGSTMRDLLVNVVNAKEVQFLVGMVLDRLLIYLAFTLLRLQLIITKLRWTLII
jgi:hypothetical protein